MLEEYTETKQFVEEEKPYWLFLDAKEELTWGLFNYFPEAHYKRAVDEAFREEAKSGLGEFVPDGGLQPVYFWYDPLTDSITTESFDDKQEAIRSLADATDGYGLDEIKHFELYEAEKLGDADRFIR